MVGMINTVGHSQPVDLFVPEIHERENRISVHIAVISGKTPAGIQSGTGSGHLLVFKE